MKKYLAQLGTFVKYLPQTALAFAKGLWDRQPARVVSVTVAVIVSAAALLGVALPVPAVTGVVVLVLPILLGGEAIRRKVAPVAPDKTPPKV